MTPVATLKEKGQTVYLMPDHQSALDLAKAKGGKVERRNLWAVVVPTKGEAKHGD